MGRVRNLPVGCACCTSRRGFLAGACGACVSMAAGVLRGRVLAAPSSQPTGRPRVRLVFACFALKQDRPTWPHIGYDFSNDIQEVTGALRRLCPEVEFLPAVCHGPEHAKKLLAGDEGQEIAGYLVYQMNNWVQVMQTVVASGKPTLVADFPFSGSGGFLVYTAGLRRTHRNFSVVASTRLEDLAASARCFAVLAKGTTEDFVKACDAVRQQRTPPPSGEPPKDDPLKLADVGQCLKALRGARLLTVGGRMQNVAKEIAHHLGIEVVAIDFKEMAAAYEAADRDQARQIAARWKAAARHVALGDDADETLEKSARQHLAQEALLKKHRSEALTINCLGGFYRGHLKAYPCLGFVELLNRGQIGACEADLLSSITMMAVKHLAGRPGYISDPVMDTSKRQIIYTHCVAPTKALGPAGPENAFEILTHNEDRKGASVRSFLPVGYMTSTVEIHPGRQEILFHRAKAVDNLVLDRACRTKLAAEVVGDVEKLLTYWDLYGWHRVTFYGDLREPMRELAQALKFRFVEEA